MGYGHTGPDVREGVVITAAGAEELLRQDLRKFEAGVTRLVRVKCSDNQYAALVSFAYNVGLGNLAKSSLLRKLNLCNYSAAANEFAKWSKAGGVVLVGLARRRAAERELFEA